MNRTEMDERNTRVLTTFHGDLADSGGRPSQRLLDALAEVAGKHADDRMPDASAAPGAPSDGGGMPAPAPATRKPRAATTPRRRQPARRSPK